MWAIIERAIKERRIILLIYCLSGILLIWLYISFFPSIEQQADEFEKLFAAYPPALMEAFNIDFASMVTIEGFIGAEQFSFVWPLMLIFFIVGFAGSAFAQEIEKGTLEVLLSQPILRLKLFWARYIAGFLLLVLFTFWTILPAILIIHVYDFEFNPTGFYLMFVLGFLFGWAIYSLAILFSTIFSDKGKVNFAVGVILILMYVIKIIASLKESLADLKYVSFFHYFDQNQALVHREIDHWAFWVFALSAIIFTILSAYIFTKRDIAT